jgi:hypothetical protein
MIILISSIITAIICAFIAFVVAFKNLKCLSNITFSTSLIATVGVISGDLMCVIRPEQLLFWKTVVFVSEALMASSWLYFTLVFARTSNTAGTGKFSRFLLFLSPIFIILLLAFPKDTFFYSPEFEIEKVLFLGNAGYFYNLLLLFYFITSIVNLEATLRSSSGINRWQIKYMILGVMGILGFNIFYYSHALLYRSIDMNLLPVRSGIFLISSLLIGFSILRRKLMDVEITVSRGIVYKSISIFVVGFYLLGLGLIGEGMRYLGPQVGKNITTFLGFTGAIAILVVLLSEQIRKKVVVFINKNFYSHKYDYRTQWLQFTQLLSSKNSFGELLSSIVEGFKNAIGVKWASIWLQREDDGGYYCAKAIETVDINVEPEKGLIDFLEHKGWVFDVNDKKCRDVALQNMEFLKKSRAILIVPLLNQGRLIGFVVLGENFADNDYNYEDYDLLKTLARQATSAIMKARLSEELSEAREMEAIGRLSSFIIHDLKNAASMLTMITQNAEEHMHNPEFQKDAIRSIANTSEKIKGIIQRLKNIPCKINMNFEYGNLGAVVKEVINELNTNGKVKLNYKEIESVNTRFDREEIKKVVVNLILNAIEATAGDGEIKVKVGIEDGMGFVMVSDNGIGMSKEFIETRLFKPFQTTKKKGLGVGLYQCKSIIEAHSGRIKVKSTEGKGTDFFIYLPIVS